MKPYPLLLKPPIKDYLWGGTRLITDFGFETTSAKAAEAWVLSCHKDGASLIANGELAGHTLPEALDQWGDAAVGDKALGAVPRGDRDRVRADIMKQVLILQV